MVSLDCERLLRHIDEHYASYLEGWEQIHTLFSHTQQVQNAPTIYDQLRSLLQHRGIQTTLLEEERDCVYGKLDRRASRTLFFYNCYTANSPEIWELLPIAIRLMALDLYQECFGMMPINIKWLLHASGKSNVIHLRSILETYRQELQADGCLWEIYSTAEERILLPIADNTPLLFLGTKGLLSIELASHITTNSIPSHYGSIVPDAAWRLLWTLNSLKNTREEILIEGFYDSLTSIEDDALASLYTLPNTASALAQQWGMQDLLLGLQGLQMHYAHLLTPTCNINFISGGDAASTPSFPSLIPPEARARVDFYLVPGQEPEDIFVRLQNHLHNQNFSDIQAQLLYQCPPAYTPLSNSFAQLVCKATAKAYGHDPLILPIHPESYPPAFLQRVVGMPLLITSSGITLSSLQQWDHPDVISSLIRGLKQTALIIHALNNT